MTWALFVYLGINSQFILSAAITTAANIAYSSSDDLLGQEDGTVIPIRLDWRGPCRKIDLYICLSLV